MQHLDHTLPGRWRTASQYANEGGRSLPKTRIAPRETIFTYLGLILLMNAGKSLVTSGSQYSTIPIRAMHEL